MGSIASGTESDLACINPLQNRLMCIVRRHLQLALQNSPALGVVIADDSRGLRLQPGAIWRHDHHDLARMLVGCALGVVDLPVQIHPVIPVHSPALQRKRIGVSKVNSPVPIPGPWNPEGIKLSSGDCSRESIDNVRRSKFLIDDSLGCRPPTIPQPELTDTS